MVAAPGKPPAARRFLAIVQASPASTGVVVLVNIVSIEAEASLKAQRVAGAEADRRHLRLAQQRLGDRHRIAGFHRQFEPVLAGIARPGHHARRAGNRCVHRAHERHPVDSAGKTRQDGGGFRPLQRQEGALEARLEGDRPIEIGPEMREIGLLAPGVTTSINPSSTRVAIRSSRIPPTSLSSSV